MPWGILVVYWLIGNFHLVWKEMNRWLTEGKNPWGAFRRPFRAKNSPNCSKIEKIIAFLHWSTLVIVLTHQSFLSCVVEYVQVYYRKSRPLGASLRTPKGPKMIENHLMFFFGQRPWRGQCPVEHRGTFVCLSVCTCVAPPPPWDSNLSLKAQIPASRLKSDHM